MAAPAREAPLWDPPGFFEPALMNYFSSPASAMLVAVFIGMLVLSIVTLRRGRGLGNPTGIVLGLIAFSLLRAAFFFIFDPPEPLLFSSSVTLAHVLLIGILFARADFPGKRTVLATLAVLLAATNQAFIIGW
jgi:hypothetical protein